MWLCGESQAPEPLWAYKSQEAAKELAPIEDLQLLRLSAFQGWAVGTQLNTWSVSRRSGVKHGQSIAFHSFTLQLHGSPTERILCGLSFIHSISLQMIQSVSELQWQQVDQRSPGLQYLQLLSPAPPEGSSWKLHHICVSIHSHPETEHLKTHLLWLTWNGIYDMMSTTQQIWSLEHRLYRKNNVASNLAFSHCHLDLFWRFKLPYLDKRVELDSDSWNQS